MNRRVLLLAILFFAVGGCSSNIERETSTEISANDIQKHIAYLASEELGGRKAGEKGNQLAAEYIQKQFKSSGLLPAGEQGTYVQTFKILKALASGEHSSIEINVRGVILKGILDENFRPMSVSSDTSASGDLVFVGYGISSDTLNFDEYAGVDVNGKIVMMLRFTPDYASRDERFRGYESLTRKVFTAREKGAAGIIMVTGPYDEETPALVNLKVDRQSVAAGLPVINLTSTLADSILLLAGIQQDLKTIQQRIYDTKEPFSFAVPNTHVTMRTELNRVYASTVNVLGLLEGTDPVLKQEYVVVGAHFDHLGMGGEGSGSMKPDTIAIHPGADDNASGTAGMLELAEYFSSRRDMIKRSIIFIGFSAEEMGLLGSAHFTNHPRVPLEKIVTMVNLDMIGRMRESTLVIEGVGTSPRWEELLWKENPDTVLKLKLKSDGYGPSDHASFYAKGIPVLFFFTNLHEDYHRPSDVWQKIHYPEEEMVLEYAARVITAIVNLPEKPQYIATTASSMAGGGGRSARVSLGIVPDFAEEAMGLKITGTRPGSAAEKAGLLGGDIIIKFGGKDVKNIYDFMYILEAHHPGDEVSLVVKRGEQTLELKAILEGAKKQ
jgi:aminopeptidase YwaD